MNRIWIVFAFIVLLLPRTARAESPRASFALIIGSNASVDTNLQPLRYADDDAARYLDLFRLLGARTYLLTRLDDNTKRLHPQAAAEASDPKKASYDAALAQLTADVAQATQRGVETTVYFVYAGHGNVQNGAGYITLEDLRISGNDLAATFQKIPATRIHVIADACASYFLAYSRGPGGERRPLDTIGLAPALGNDPRIGLLLSTSSARESHEWDAFQSGVFSHEVRSGLYGAADADNDGQVSYREIAAFITRANASIANERYRPDVHARAPRGTETLLDLRKANGRRIEIDGKHAGHYFLEDSRGVRIADIHNSPDQTLSLMRPAPNGRVYLRRISDDKEIVIDARPDVVSVSELEARPARVASRGAAHEAFNSLFALPFDMDVVAAYPVMMCVPADGPPPAPAPPRPVAADRATPSSWRRPAGIALLGTAAVALAVGATLTITASDDLDPSFPQSYANDVNHEKRTMQLAAALFYGGGIAALATGIVFLVAPSPRVASTINKVQAGVTSNGAFMGYGGSF